jgi:[ribosomal protein S5]-alanine N-acetyltransferase
VRRQNSWLKENLQSERLSLRPTRPGDEDWIIELFTNAEVRKYLGGAMSEEQARIAVQITGELWGHFAIMKRIGDRVIGSLSFTHDHGPWEISYELFSEYWGYGFGTEAIKLALLWFFKNTEEKEVSAVTQIANLRSCRALEKAGAQVVESFQYKGFAVNRYMFKKGIILLRQEDKSII